MLFKFPESDAIRRLAANLSTSLTATTDEANGLDLALSSAIYMRRVPWFGVSTRFTERPSLLDDSTVGQYFARFNFAGLDMALADQDTDRDPVQSGVRRYPFR